MAMNTMANLYLPGVRCPKVWPFGFFSGCRNSAGHNTKVALCFSAMAFVMRSMLRAPTANAAFARGFREVFFATRCRCIRTSAHAAAAARRPKAFKWLKKNL
jgi:hypothetical protein